MTDEAYSADANLPRMQVTGPEARAAVTRAGVSLASAMLGLYGLGAVLTYSPEDPSLNVATASAAQNLFGEPGAVFADIAMQAAGAAAPLALGSLFAAGALRIWRRRMADPISRARLAAGVAGAALMAAGASTLPAPEGWPLACGLGGVLGDAASSLIHGLLSAPGLPFPEILTGVLCAVGGAAAWGWAFHVRGRDIANAGRAARQAGGAAQRALTYVTDRVRPEPAQDWGNERAIEHRPAQRPAAPRRPITHEEPQAARSAAPHVDGAEAPPPRRATQRQSSAAQRQAPQQRPAQSFELPSSALLAAPKPRTSHADQATLRELSRRLADVLADFGVQGEVGDARPGPVVTLFEFEPAPGVKSARVVGLADDIARSMSATVARVAVIPGRNAIGIELPNPKRETVYLRTLLGSNAFISAAGQLPLALGETIEGEPFAVDLAKMPHLLIAGTTGSGKSVGINAMILSLLFRFTPAECRFIMIDPKMLELSVYEGIPHLLSPVVTDPKKAVASLKWAVREMEDRYRRMAKLGVRNITSYNERVEQAIRNGERLERTVHAGFDPTSGEAIYETRELPLEPMPYIVVVIDEMADLMITAGKEIEAAVQRLAQMARAAGIHVIMATQRPSVDVITGTIKANFPTRISYKVTSKIDSRTILGEPGAEQLVDKGDLLLMEGGRARRLHGPFVTDQEVEKVVEMLKAQGAPQYRTDVTEEPTAQAYEEADLFDAEPGAGGGADDIFDRAVEIVRRDRKATTSYLQRRLQIGYNRAATLIERMEKEGVISAPSASGKREVLLPALSGEED